MTNLFKQNLDGVSPGTFSSSSAGTGDTGTKSVQGSGLTVDNSGLRGPRVKMVQSSGVACAFTATFAAQPDLFITDYFSLEQQSFENPPVSSPVLSVKNGSNKAFDLVHSTSGRIRLFKANNTLVGTGAETDADFLWAAISQDSGNSEHPSREIRREISLWPNRVIVKLWDGDSGSGSGAEIDYPRSPIWEYDSGVLSGTPFGSQFDRVQWGNPLTSHVALTSYVDSITVNDTNVTGALVGTDPTIAFHKREKVTRYFFYPDSIPGFTGGRLRVSANPDDGAFSGNVTQVDDSTWDVTHDENDYFTVVFYMVEEPSGRSTYVNEGIAPYGS